jgi:hypothetical protein
MSKELSHTYNGHFAYIQREPFKCVPDFRVVEPAG